MSDITDRLDAARREPPALAAQLAVELLIEAAATIRMQRHSLAAAREFVARDLQSTLECVCTLDKATGQPIESTIDPEEVEHVASIRAVLAHIDQVLGDA
jgi:hypothetical protein